ncbi:MULTISPECIES: hypothetical protein [Hyphomicrobiales]|uniref:Uncharacterized protein n=2 Tax=Hyphomicrobiales TaxID=356 RepID=A0A6L3Y4Y1_9HYPH|nr:MULTISPECIES: hypothetical protein [Hyphomicrobiales]KAB2676666.1 hypothetical protein F9L08_26125 [Brucella tritici]MBO0130503.1 hypothetical protein [Agrobacterium burrii]
MTGQKKAKQTQIAILGWGSLIWDVRPEFDMYHDEWLLDGPTLPLEFSRISESRKGALTLVIDTQHGAPCRAAYSLSWRSNPDDAIADLRCREGTIMKRMGFHFRDGSRTCAPPVPDAVAEWAAEKEYDVVVWTGLPSNFKDKTGKEFSVAEAIRHLQSLTKDGKSMAAIYVWNAPDLIRTPLRNALQVEPWFAASATAGDAAHTNASLGGGEPPI